MHRNLGCKSFHTFSFSGEQAIYISTTWVSLHYKNKYKSVMNYAPLQISYYK